MPKIIIFMEGGLIQGIEGIPPGTIIEVWDYDVEGTTDDIVKDAKGDEHTIATWTADA